MHVERTPQGLIIAVESEPETDRLGRALADVLGPGSVVGLVGPLGAGKTRLARAVAEGFGVDPGAIASPSFVLIHEYEGRLPVYHFDAYRLRSADEFEALGVSDYWDGDGVCLVEWADRVADRLPARRWTVRIEPVGPSARRFEVTAPEGATDMEVLARTLGVV
jgi:tRNA threonylcarbamoyladenosine biosynthesis protein TsaE